MNKIILIVGKTASGKSTLTKKLEKSNFCEVVSTTTREMRADEINGVHYNFVSEDSFKSMLENEEMVEHSIIRGYYYGVSKKEFERISNSGKTPMLVCDPVGIKNIAEYAKDKKTPISTILITCEEKEIAKRIISRVERDFSLGEKSNDAIVKTHAVMLTHFFIIEKNWDQCFEYDVVVDTTKKSEENALKAGDYINSQSAEFYDEKKYGNVDIKSIECDTHAHESALKTFSKIVSLIIQEKTNGRKIDYDKYANIILSASNPKREEMYEEKISLP